MLHCTALDDNIRLISAFQKISGLQMILSKVNYAIYMRVYIKLVSYILCMRTYKQCSPKKTKPISRETHNRNQRG